MPATWQRTSSTPSTQRHSRRPGPPWTRHALLALVASLASVTIAPAQIAIRGETVYTMAAPPISGGVVIIREGRIEAVGPASSTPIPDGFRVLEALVVTPGLIDAHCVIGISGLLNQAQDQDQLDQSGVMQPELRALDAYNPDDPLIAWVRGFGVTTLHTGHATGQLISGQTMIVKTAGRTVDAAVIVPAAAVAATLGPQALKRGKEAPGTRSKMVAMLRAELLKAQEYRQKRERAEPADRPARDLRLEVLGQVLSGELPLLVTAHRAQDIQNALRLAREFELRILLDGAAEAPLLIDEIKHSGVPVLVHPPMARFSGELENASFETASRLRQAGIPVALQSGYESYVPKTRVVLFEAGIAFANGLDLEEALATITVHAARILRIDNRVGSLAPGMDADVALFDGNPFEYTTHCTGVIINGNIASEERR